MTVTASSLRSGQITRHPEITIWCDPSELAEIALRKAHRSDDAESASQLLELASGDRIVVREAMEHVVMSESGALAQRALRLLFDAYQLAEH